jgi:glutamate racemase
MEPAVKPAAHLSATGVVGVVATAGTLDGPLYESVVERFGAGVEIVAAACPDWVELVEAGMIDAPETIESVARCLEPLIERRADRIVLGCTHFPLLERAIRRALAERAEIVDPGPAVARQTLRIAEPLGIDRGSGRVTIELTGTDRGAADVLALVGLANTEVAVISQVT